MLTQRDALVSRKSKAKSSLPLYSSIQGTAVPRKASLLRKELCFLVIFICVIVQILLGLLVVTYRPNDRGIIFHVSVARFGNQLLQYFCTNYMAHVLDFDLHIAVNSDQFDAFHPEEHVTISKKSLESSWLFQIYLYLFADFVDESRGISNIGNFNVKILGNKRNRYISSSWWYEQSSFIYEAVELAWEKYNVSKAIRENSESFMLHPWLPSDVIKRAQEISEISKIKLKPLFPTDQSHSNLEEKFQSLYHVNADLLKDLDSHLVIHIRLGDIGRDSFVSGHHRQIREWARQHYKPDFDWTKSYFLSGIADRDSAPQSLSIFSKAGIYEEYFKWKWYVKEDLYRNFSLPLSWGTEDESLLLQMIDSDTRISVHLPLPLDYYINIIEKERYSGKWNKILIVCDSDSLHHPTVKYLVNKYDALLQGSWDPLFDFTTLVMAKYLVLSTGTFSWLPALIGRAVDIHYPHAGFFTIFTEKMSCLFPNKRIVSQPNKQWIFHDIIRSNVEKQIASLSSSDESFDHCNELFSSPFHQTYEQIVNYYSDPICRSFILNNAIVSRTQIDLVKNSFDDLGSNICSDREKQLI
jgi:hypothetical protein